MDSNIGAREVRIFAWKCALGDPAPGTWPLTPNPDSKTEGAQIGALIAVP